MMKKSGDTLIEVAFAIGIFSLVAIIVVSVISASTTGAQSSLELTLTREELDAQAEALRFIHDSYVSGSQSQDTRENRYADLWNAIADKATDGVPQYNPTTCSELYKSNGFINTDNQNNGGKTPFIINTRQISSVNNSDNLSETDINNIVITQDPNKSSSSFFFAPTTYPRILYGSSTAFYNENTDQTLEEQVNANSLTTIKRVEGIYIIAVKGEEVTVIDGSTSNPQSAYYDFYIRSCWMPLGSDRASTISTVVRLYDPAVICYGANCPTP